MKARAVLLPRQNKRLLLARQATARRLLARQSKKTLLARQSKSFTMGQTTTARVYYGPDNDSKTEA